MDAEDTHERRRTAHPGEEAHRALALDHPRSESRKNYHTILEQQTSAAEVELHRPALALFLSGLTAGLDLGFGPFAMAVSASLLDGLLPVPALEALNANLYAVGFVFVVLGYSALFTEQTTSAVLPVLSGRAGPGRLWRLWGIVLGANLLGAALFAGFAATLGPAMGLVDPETFGMIARRLLGKPWWVVLLSAVAAGWLMGLLTWLVVASRDTISQILLVWLITTLMGAAAFHHSISGSTEVLMAVFVGRGATVADYLGFLPLAVLGNALGGSVFVAGLKYAHIENSVEG